MKTRKELAAKLGIHVKTLKKYCLALGITLPRGHLLPVGLCEEIEKQINSYN